jgi:ATP-dependent Lon protease
MKILSDTGRKKSLDNEYPMIPLREMVVFPDMLKSFYVGRSESIEAVNVSMKNYNKLVFLATQKNSEVEEPARKDIYPIGVLAEIIEVRPGPDKKITKILIRGIERARIKSMKKRDSVNVVSVEKISFNSLDDSLKSEALLNFVIKEFKKFSSLSRIPVNVLKSISEADDEDTLVNLIIPHLKCNIESQIEILEEEDIEKRLTQLSELVASNIEVLQLEKKINMEVRKKMEKSQKEYFLHEQIKEIQKELGSVADTDVFSVEEFEQHLDKIGMPEIIKAKALKEHGRLSKMPPVSPEAGIIRTYIDLLLELPWTKKSEDTRDLNKARDVLDEDHYSLRKVKNRILEFLAVRQLNPATKGPILCFVGPPGTGKTSLGKSVARAIDREFIRISLGGVRDEAEIRGHRRTYLGALPGKIIQSMKKAQTVNPVFLLDEIDKMSSDFRGDPAAALLEVLDPEQNNSFVDHYLEVPYNLSEVMFITTANSLQGIPYALRDRMELIYISGYTELEKLKIAQQFLMVREQSENGLNDKEITISNPAIIEMIRSYTMEAGVRSLQRQIAQVYRKIAKRIVLQEESGKKVTINTKNLHKYLGKKKYTTARIDEILDIGVCHGLAWSEVGGTILPIEVVLYPGTGKIILTGKLGDIMKESAQTAFSYIRANAYLYSIKYSEFYKNYDAHIHFPEGAIPKDGPSAGIAITCGILSALTRESVSSSFAMTGEITLTGKVLPIGGLKEKALAAVRHKKKKIIIPRENEKDIEELPKTIRNKVEFVLVERAREVFKLVFDESINNHDSQIDSTPAADGKRKQHHDDQDLDTIIPQ